MAALGELLEANHTLRTVDMSRTMRWECVLGIGGIALTTSRDCTQTTRLAMRDCACWDRP